MSGDSNHDFAEGLVAAGRRESAREGAEGRAFERAAMELRSATEAGDVGHDSVAGTNDVVARAVEPVIDASDARDPLVAREARGQKGQMDILRTRASARRKHVSTAALASAFVAAAASFGLFVKMQCDKGDVAAAASAAAVAEQAQAQAQLATLNAELAAENARVDRAQAALADAKDEAARLSAQAQLAAAQNALQQTKSSFSTVTKASAKHAAPCTCNHSDPLCGCL